MTTKKTTKKTSGTKAPARKAPAKKAASARAAAAEEPSDAPQPVMMAMAESESDCADDGGSNGSKDYQTG